VSRSEDEYSPAEWMGKTAGTEFRILHRARNSLSHISSSESNSSQNTAESALDGSIPDDVEGIVQSDDLAGKLGQVELERFLVLAEQLLSELFDGEGLA